MAEVPSINTNIQTVNRNHIANNTTVMITPTVPVLPNAFWIVIDHNTVDNCACAKERAHNLKYDAV